MRGYWLRPCVHLCLFVTSRCFIRTDGPIEVHRRGTACSTYAANRSCCQHRLSTVDLVDDTYDGRRVLAVYCASVNCNPLTSLLRLVVLQPVHVFVRQLTTFRPTRRVARSVCSPSAVAQILVGTRCTQSRVCAFFCSRRIWVNVARDPVSGVVASDSAHCRDVIVSVSCTFAAISPVSGRKCVRPVQLFVCRSRRRQRCQQILTTRCKCVR